MNMWFLEFMNPVVHLDGNMPSVKRMSKFKNMFEMRNVLMQLTNEALERYYIEGLPETCNPRVVLESFLWYGGVYFFIENGQVFALPGNNTSSPTLYGDYTNAIVYGRNGTHKNIKLFIPYGDNSELVRTDAFGKVAPEEGAGVWVRENRMAYPFMFYVLDFADKIADTYRTLDVARVNIKKPYVITAEESIIPTVKEFFKKRENNEEYIVSSGVFPADKITISPLVQNPENIRDCTGLIDFYYSMFRDQEAISSSPVTIDKKAQVSVPELKQNQGAQAITIGTCANTIQEGLDLVNKYLGTNMRFVSRIKEAEEENDEKIEKEEQDNDEDI